MDYISAANPALATRLAEGFTRSHETKSEIIEKSASVFREFIKKSHDYEMNLPKEGREVGFNLLPKDIHIGDSMSKLAGMVVYDTTPEGIEQFLKEFMYNELSFFPDKVNLAVGIMPLDNNPINDGTGRMEMSIANASGTVDITYGNAMLQIPWVMRDKEILPFDTIQMGMESSVYTRENIKNILFNIKTMMENQQNANSVNNNPSLSGYMGAGTRTGPLTDGGFMGDMLQIQSLIGSSSGMGSTYASKIDDLLEKTASIRQVKIDYLGVEKAFRKQFLVAAEKLAAAEYDEPAESALEKKAFLDSLNRNIHADVQILGNAEKFSFTEKDGMSVGETQGIIFKSLINVRGVALDEKLVIAADGRFKLLRNGDKFAFNLDTSGEKESPEFYLKYRDIESLNVGYVYTANVGGTFTVPFIVTKVTSGANYSLNTRLFYSCHDVKGESFTLVSVSNISDNQLILKSKKDFLVDVSQREEPKKLGRYNVILSDKLPILCLSPNTKFIQLKHGAINNISDVKTAMFLFDGNVKLASFKDEIKVTLVARDSDHKFNVEMKWFDNKFKQDKHMSFDNVPEPRLKGILRTIGFDYAKVNEITYRASKEGTASYELTSGLTPWMVKPEVSADMAVNKAVTNMRESLFSAENAKKAIPAVLGGLLGGALAGTALGEPLMGLKSFASESEALAEKLEKVAIAKESSTFSKLAALMVIKNRIDNMLVKCATVNAEFEGAETLTELHEVTPYLQKLAYDLVELKINQCMLRNEMISPNVINATLRHLDGLHKYAQYFKKTAGISDSLDNLSNIQGAHTNKIKAEVIPEVPPASGKRMVSGSVGKAVDAFANIAASPIGALGLMAAPPVINKLLKRTK